MTGEKVSFEEAAANQSAADSRHNDRSSIGFPYHDLDTAVDVARAVYNRAGLGSCEIDELAAEMRQTVSGAFRQKTSTAKLFELVEKESRGEFRLSATGQKIVKAETEAEGRAEAFLTIPLYKAIYDRYRGHLLPPTKALEREMIALGVAPKQADKARQAFERSARQAGFYAEGEDRLVAPRFDREPRTRPVEPETPAQQPPKPSGGGGSNGNGTSGGKPLRYQLIDLLDPETMDEKEQQAVYTLINYLARQRKGGETKAAAGSSSAAA